MRRPWVVLALVLATLWGIHLVATAGSGLALPPHLRDVVGASASTVASRFHAQLTAPFFHDHLFHLAYNSLLFAIGLPVCVRAYGARALAVAYAASPIVGVAVDVLLILPLASAGNAIAIEAAPARLVGSSIVAFALLGMAVASQRARLGVRAWVVVGAIVLYEVTLAMAGITRPFVWAYHVGGLAVGLAAGLTWTARAGRASGAT